MKLIRYSGWYLVATGVIHNIIGLIFGRELLLGMHKDGWWNTIEPGGVINFSRSGIWWFLLLGCFWILLGYLMQQWVQRLNQPLPGALGWGFLTTGAATAMVLPASGAWLLLPQGLLILLASRSHHLGTTIREA